MRYAGAKKHPTWDPPRRRRPRAALALASQHSSVAEQRFCKATVGGSNPSAGSTTKQQARLEDPKGLFAMLRIRCGKKELVFDRPRVAGILNVTPDSFSDGGRFLESAAALDHARAMIAEGADMIDIGGESTRPGSRRISAEEELGRVLPVLAALAPESPVPISIDTTKPEVAEECLKRGADIINDVSGLRNPAMREVAARHLAPVIIMHMQGTPETMQKNPHYDRVVEEVMQYLEKQAAVAKKEGIDQIIVDPGIGFGKTVEHNLTILNRLHEFRQLGYPVMVGVSRKSFIQKILGIGSDATLEGTLAAAAIAAYNGADVLRVHDVAAGRRAVAIAEAIRSGRYDAGR